MDLRSRQKSLMPLPTSLRDACDWDYATRIRQGEDGIRVFTVLSILGPAEAQRLPGWTTSCPARRVRNFEPGFGRPIFAE